MSEQWQMGDVLHNVEALKLLESDLVVPVPVPVPGPGPESLPVPVPVPVPFQ